MIKYLIMDVDGTLTDGKVYIGNNGEIMKGFSIKDGYGISFLLKKQNITPVIITGRKSSIVEHRCRELGINNVFQGIINKFDTLVKFVGENNLNQCAYIGDDILDLQCMKPIKEAGGIVGCPADAVEEIRAVSDYVCKNNAGNGAVREFIEWLLNNNKWIATTPIAFSNQPPQSLRDSSPTIRGGASRDLNNGLGKINLQERVKQAISHISRLNHKELKVGKYEVSDNFYYIVKELETQPREQCIFESHRKYIDIQWVIEGQMAFETADVSTLKIEKEYDSEKDVALWQKQENLMQTILSSGSYAVLYPNNAHISALVVNNQPQKIKLIVGKIKIG